MPDFQKLLAALADHDVSFVLVGGLAAAAHGSSILTEDVDVCTSFDAGNMGRLLSALNGFGPRHRLVGRTKQLSEGPEELARLKNLYLSTDVGYIDFLSEIAGVGGFEAVMRASVQMTIFGKKIRVLGLDALIASKKAMGRPKDAETVIQLETILQKTKSHGILR